MRPDQRTWIDLPAGTFQVETVLPPGTLRRGVWTLCAWFTTDPALPVSNPNFPLPRPPA